MKSNIAVGACVYVPTLDGAVHAAAAVQQVVCQRGCVCQAEKISQLTGGEAGVICPFAQVNHRPRKPLFGHLSLENTLLDSACKEGTPRHKTVFLIMLYDEHFASLCFRVF